MKKEHEQVKMQPRMEISYPMYTTEIPILTSESK